MALHQFGVVVEIASALDVVIIGLGNGSPGQDKHITTIPLCIVVLLQVWVLQIITVGGRYTQDLSGSDLGVATILLAAWVS